MVIYGADCQPKCSCGCTRIVVWESKPPELGGLVALFMVCTLCEVERTDVIAFTKE